MGYDNWKLRSDMDDAIMHGLVHAVDRIAQPSCSQVCAGPCVRCARDKEIAVSTQEINGERVCELHAECCECGQTVDEMDQHVTMGDVYCSFCYNHLGLDDPQDARDER